MKQKAWRYYIIIKKKIMYNHKFVCTNNMVTKYIKQIYI